MQAQEKQKNINEQNEKKNKLKWKTPILRHLGVQETKYNVNYGSDGGNYGNSLS